MFSTKLFISVIIGLALLFGLYDACFVVQEGQSALKLRLGKIVLDANNKPQIYFPGLHCKWPWIIQVKKLDTRLQNLEAESPRILTEEQKYLYVNYYAKWQIANLPLYYISTGGDLEKAQQLLIQRMNDILRTEFGKKTLQEVIADDRLKIMEVLKTLANVESKNLGIVMVDVRIQGIDLLQEVLDSVFLRMKTKREQVATEYRADGLAQAESIKSAADARATKMIADARNQAAQSRATGDTKAAEIYIQAYAQDPEFYSFYQSLQAYQQVFSSKNTMMVLRLDSQFLHYLNPQQGIHHGS